jgi:hypothetical protein
MLCASREEDVSFKNDTVIQTVSLWFVHPLVVYLIPVSLNKVIWYLKCPICKLALNIISLSVSILPAIISMWSSFDMYNSYYVRD